MHYAMSFLVSMAYSCQEVTQALCNSDNFSKWLKRLTLDAPEVTFMKYAIFNFLVTPFCDALSNIPSYIKK